MNTIVCLKWGSLYGPEYVNNLYAMCKRNLTLPFEFVCYTDNTKGILPYVKTKELPDHLKGWWGKTYYFADKELEGTVLALDLDVVIIDNMDCFFEYPGEFIMKEDYAGHGCSSVVMRFEAGKHPHIYDNLNLDAMNHSIDNTTKDFKRKKYWGDQIWITEQMEGNITIWPKEWIPKFSIDCHREIDSKIPYADIHWKKRKAGEFFIPNDGKIIVFAGKNGNNVTHFNKVKPWWNTKGVVR